MRRREHLDDIDRVKCEAFRDLIKKPGRRDLVILDFTGHESEMLEHERRNRVMNMRIDHRTILRREDHIDLVHSLDNGKKTARLFLSFVHQRSNHHNIAWGPCEGHE